MKCLLVSDTTHLSGSNPPINLAQVKATGKDCVENREMEPCNPKGTVARFARANEVPFQEMSVMRILYAKFRGEREQKLSQRFILVDIATLSVHLFVLVLLPSIPLCLHALSAQHIYAITTAMGDPMDYGDVYGKFIPYIPLFGGGGKHTLTLVSAILTWNFFYILFALMRVFLHYIGLRRTNKFKILYDWIFSLIFFVELVIFFTWIGTSKDTNE